MALVGTFKLYEDVETGETKTVKMTVPFNLPEDHPEYQNRGKEIELENPVIEEQITEFPNSYVIVRSAAMHQAVGVDGIKNVSFNIMYSVYSSKDNKTTDFFNPVYSGEVSDLESNFNDNNFSKENIISYSYSILKGMRGFEDLIKD